MVKKTCVLLLSFAHFSKKKFLLFGRIFLFFFLFSSIQEKHFCEQTPVLLVFFALYLSLSLKKLFRIFKMNLSEFLCFSLLRFFSTFFRHFFFVHHVSVSPFFHFLFCLISFIFLISFFLNSVSLPSLSSFFEQQFPLCIKKKNSSTYHFSHACVPSLCPFADTFVHLLSLFFLFVFFRFSHMCFPFPFVFSVNNLSERQVEGTVANLKKKNMFVYLPFCWALFSNLLVFAQSFVKNQIAYSMRVVLPFFSPLLSFFL